MTTLIHPITRQERVWPGTGKTGQTAIAPIEARPQRIEMPEALGYLIRPEARERWLHPSVSFYTPQMVESVIRFAMAGNIESQWEMFDLMEATWPRLSKNLNELKDAVVSLEWGIQPWAPKGGKPSPEAQRRAELVEELIWGMVPRPDADENEFEDTVRDLMDARGKGLSVLEIAWHGRELASGGSAHAPRATRWVQPKHYGYGDAEGEERLMLRLPSARRELRGFTGPSQDDLLPFPDHKFLIGVCKAKTGHPLGSSMLRLLGFWWAAANFTADWFLNFAQIFGQPLRWATYDQNISPADRITLENMLANMGSAAWGMFPAGTTIELKEAAKGATDNPQLALLNFADKVCDLVVLRQTLTSDVQDSGSRALGEVHEKVLGGVKLGCASWCARMLNAQLVHSICVLNFGNARECPYFQPALETEEDPKANADRDNVLLNAGVAMPREWFYHRHKIPIPAPNDEVIVGRPMVAPGGFGLPGMEDGTDGTNGTDRTDIRAKDASEKLTDRVLEDLTGVEAKWLAGVKPFFARLVRLAKDEKLSDAEFIAALEKARREMPELFTKLNAKAVADALEGAMGAACVNGALRGAMVRRVGRVRQEARR